MGRLATISPDGRPQIAPVGFRYNIELDTIDIGGFNMSQSKKFRNILTNPNVSFVIDNVLPPWQPRGVEIRGTAQAIDQGGKALFEADYNADNALIRVSALQIIGWCLDTDAYKPLNRKVNA